MRHAVDRRIGLTESRHAATDRAVVEEARTQDAECAVVTRERAVGGRRARAEGLVRRAEGVERAFRAVAVQRVVAVRHARRAGVTLVGLGGLSRYRARTARAFAARG